MPSAMNARRTTTIFTVRSNSRIATVTQLIAPIKRNPIAYICMYTLATQCHHSTISIRLHMQR